MKGLLCIRLRTAGLLIGWIGFALSFVSVVVFIMCFDRMDELANLIASRMEDSELSLQKVRRLLCFVCSLYLGMNLINLIASTMLIVGISRERHVLLVPWLFNSGMWLFFNFVYFIYFATITIHPSNAIAIPVLTAGITLSLEFFIWLLIYILYKTIQDDREKQKLLRATSETKLYNRPSPRSASPKRSRKK